MSQTPEKKEVIARVPVQVRETSFGENLETREPTVRCPITRKCTPLERCSECPRLAHVIETPDGLSAVYCRIPEHTYEAMKSSGHLEERLEHTCVTEVMGTTVSCVDAGLDARELAHFFATRNIHSAPVVDEHGTLCGMVTAGDLLRGISKERATQESVPEFPADYTGLLVEDLMSTEVISLHETASLAEAAQVMARNRLHRLPIVTGFNTVVGILTLSDLVRSLAIACRPRASLTVR